MVFTVTYRGGTGETESLELDVPGKAEVWAELKKRGISALSVQEGASKVRKPRGGRPPRAARGIAAGAVVVAAAICAWFFFKGGNPPPGDPEGNAPRRTAEPAPARVPKPEPAPAPAPEEKKTGAEAPLAPEPVSSAEAEPGREESKPKSRRAPSTAKKYPRRVIPRRPEPPQKFKYDSDDLIGAFLEIVPGTPMEGGLRFDKIGRDFEKSLTEDVALAEGQDNEYNRKLREYVRETKKEILETMRRENKTFGQVMQEQFDQLIEMGQYKRDLEQELRQIRKSGEFTDEEYGQFVEASNKMLESKGCSPLKIPKATYYQLERYRKLRAAKEADKNVQPEGGNRQ